MSQDNVVMKMPCEVYTRVVGYLRPISSFNAGKRQEVEDRVPFNMGKALSGAEERPEIHTQRVSEIMDAQRLDTSLFLDIGE